MIIYYIQTVNMKLEAKILKYLQVCDTCFMFVRVSRARFFCFGYFATKLHLRHWFQG
jgi:hypothetical protein